MDINDRPTARFDGSRLRFGALGTPLGDRRSMSGEIDAPRVRLDLISRPEAARLVRSMSSAAGEALGFDPELLSDVNTAVAEACNNVILHAYRGEPGPMSVEVEALPGTVEVTIQDHGSGIGPAVPDQDRLKVGLALMSALADRAESPALRTEGPKSGCLSQTGPRRRRPNRRRRPRPGRETVTPRDGWPAARRSQVTWC